MNSELQKHILEAVKDYGTRGVTRAWLIETEFRETDRDLMNDAIAELEKRNLLFRNPDGRYTFSKNRFE